MSPTTTGTHDDLNARKSSADMAAWTVRQISDQRKLRSTRSTVLGMLEQVTRDQGPTLARALRDAQARRFA